ncbi:Bud site selection protein, Revert to axial protein 1 [Recurvomyces mirabilis]|uniref:Bud site selection protein, Revert to axial protein 1 n=1 Tax=Recurvomyces mirabilis TaxID=574656 RepID=A0AAE0WLU0_9PEZI|nr:Bud site selection protein, Revert to axial protein 1 [Recurvomyces mirabilis]KAK5155240.1 Bud site selection protein, Revert to axial protein 1 [Recurvomyces mirabilis]
MESRSTTPEGGTRERLPNLFEVLSRRTLAPVDLFSFYIYMRDVQRSVDYLDFWLDVSQHMSLCRHYVRELRRSVLISTPDLEKGGAGSKRSSQVLDNYNLERTSSDQGPSGTQPQPQPRQTSKERERLSTDQRLSAFLRDDRPTGHSPQNSTASQKSEQNTPGSEQPPRPSFVTGTGTNTPSPLNNSNGSPHHTVARADIRASAEKILYTYLLPGAEREIILPQGILNEITTAIEKEGRDDPEVFDAAKDYVFQAMERDAFPGFLRAKALGNIVQPSLLLRLIVGLVAMFAGFWTAFVLIFLGKGRVTRCWVIWPFTFGVYFLASHQYLLDPILALVGYSEYTIGSVHRIKEPFIRKLLNKRAMMCLGWIFIIDVVLCCIFILVPSHRL